MNWQTYYAGLLSDYVSGELTLQEIAFACWKE